METEMTEHLKIEDYIKAIDGLARAKSTWVFKNTKPELAAIVLAKIVQYSNKEVRIYEDSLTGDIADKHELFLASVEEYVKSGKSLKIAIRDDIENDSKTYLTLTDLAARYERNFQIRVVNHEFVENVKAILQKDVNFTVGDDIYYRIETAENVQDERDAICCFNSSDVATKLANIFDANYNNSRPLKLQTFA